MRPLIGSRSHRVTGEAGPLGGAGLAFLLFPLLAIHGGVHLGGAPAAGGDEAAAGAVVRAGHRAGRIRFVGDEVGHARI